MPMSDENTIIYRHAKTGTSKIRLTLKARMERDSAFREALLSEGVDALLAGEVDTGKAILRDYITATIGFESLAKRTATQRRTLMRMFAPAGTLKANNLFAVIRQLQSHAGIHLRVHATKRY